MFVHFLFVIVCFILDQILQSFFPNSFLINDVLFISNLGFCAMILTIRKFDFINSCLFAFASGMIYDFCFTNTFLLYAIIYTIVACLLKLWSKHMTDTIIESLVLCITTIFVKDLIVYCYVIFQRISDMPIVVWVERFELLTLLANLVLVMMLVFLIRIKDDFLAMKAVRIRKGEKIEWFRLKSKE